MSLLKKTMVVFASMSLAYSASATLFNDSTGEAIGGNTHIDIVSVDVVTDLTDITFTINLAGDPIATDWGKYLVGVDSVGGGDVAGNAWARPISMSSGMDYFIGSWVDSGDGAEVYSWDGAAWVLDHATYALPSDIDFPAKTTSSVALTTSLASLGLGVNDTFVFDVFTTGGGGTDTAVDALSDPTQTTANWDDLYDSTSVLAFTVPEPATLSMILIGLGAIAFRKTRRK